MYLYTLNAFVYATHFSAGYGTLFLSRARLRNQRRNLQLVANARRPRAPYDYLRSVTPFTVASRQKPRLSPNASHISIGIRVPAFRSRTRLRGSAEKSIFAPRGQPRNRQTLARVFALPFRSSRPKLLQFNPLNLSQRQVHVALYTFLH